MKSSTLKVLTASFVILSMLALLSIIAPTTSQAHPPIGITPSPTPGGPPTVEASPPDKPDRPSAPLNIALNCNLICPGVPQAAEVWIPVNVVHVSTGWNTEATLSNGQGISLDVPHAGEYNVYMTGPPTIHAAFTALVPSDFPRLLGTVYTGGSQSVNCPFTPNCPIPTPTIVAAVEDVLPITGDSQMATTVSLLVILSGLILTVLLVSGFISAKRQSE